MKSHLQLLAVLALSAVSLPAGAQTFTTQVYATGNNSHYLEHGSWIEFTDYVSEYEPFVHTDKYEGYLVLRGWFGTEEGDTVLKKNSEGKYHFTGPSGGYVFMAHEGRGGKNYMEVLPTTLTDGNNYKDAVEKDLNGQILGKDKIATGFKAKNYNASNFSTYNPLTGTGAIYASGGPDFAFPNARWDKIYGWKGGDDRLWGDNTTALPMFKGENDTNYQIYSIDIRTGEQMKSGADFMFKLYQTPEYEVDPTYTAAQTTNPVYKKYREFRSKAKGDENNSSCPSCTIWPADQRSADIFYVTTGTNTSNVSDGEGNITPKKIGFDSDMPKIPDGYTFRFTVQTGGENMPTQTYGVNPSEINATSYTHVPLTIREIAVPASVKDVPEIQSEAADNYTIDLNHSGNSHVISVRDALRLDCGVLYENQYNAGVGIKPVLLPTATEEERNNFPTNYENWKTAMDNSGVFKFKKLTITGELTMDDIPYLSWLIRNDRLESLDLSGATIAASTEGHTQDVSTWAANEIVTQFAAYSESLKSVVLPKDLTSVGREAFAHCDNLESVTFTSGTTTNITIHDNAFGVASKLETLDLGSDHTFTIEGQAFQKCEVLTGINHGNGTTITAIGVTGNGITGGTFQECRKLSSDDANFIIKDVKRIELYDFLADWDITNINIPADVEYIGSAAFGETGLTSVTVNRATCPTTATKESNGFTVRTVWEGSTFHTNVFDRVNANKCVVNFANDAATGDNYQSYRLDPSFRYLLTKTGTDTEEAINYVSQTHADFHLDRTFAKGWSTLVLPFDITAAEVKNVYNGAINLYAQKGQSDAVTAITLSNVLEGTESTFYKPAYMSFVKGGVLCFIYLASENTQAGLTDNANIPTGKPFILKAANAITSDGVTFQDVDLKADATVQSYSTTHVEGENYDCTFYGTFTNMTENIQDCYLMAAADYSFGGRFLHADYAHFKGYRGYIKLYESSATPAKKQYFDVELIDKQNTPTAIRLNAYGEEVKSADIYSIDGKLVRANATSTTGLAKGVYIVGGKKIVVK